MDPHLWAHQLLLGPAYPQDHQKAVKGAKLPLLHLPNLLHFCLPFIIKYTYTLYKDPKAVSKISGHRRSSISALNLWPPVGLRTLHCKLNWTVPVRRERWLWSSTMEPPFPAAFCWFCLLWGDSQVSCTEEWFLGEGGLNGLITVRVWVCDLFWHWIIHHLCAKKFPLLFSKAISGITSSRKPLLTSATLFSHHFDLGIHLFFFLQSLDFVHISVVMAHILYFNICLWDSSPQIGHEILKAEILFTGFHWDLSQ